MPENNEPLDLRTMLTDAGFTVIAEEQYEQKDIEDPQELKFVDECQAILDPAIEALVARGVKFACVLVTVNPLVDGETCVIPLEYYNKFPPAAASSTSYVLRAMANDLLTPNEPEGDGEPVT